MYCLKSINRALAIGMTLAISAFQLPQEGRAAATVLAGWDLFQTTGGTTFAGVPFAGVPLGTFDFGGSIGIKPTGSTDTIVERMGSSVGPGLTAPVPIELVALQLVSVVPFSFGGPDPVAFHYITLQSRRSILEGGPINPSTGMITVTVGPEAPVHGSFDSFFDVYFDIRHGSLTGPIEMSSMLTMSSAGSVWGHTAPPGSMLISDVNYLLNGSDTTNDFHPAFVSESHPSGAIHNVQPALQPIPFGFSPGLGVVLCSALLGVGHLRRKLAARRTAS